MKATVPCPICHTQSQCTCQRSMTRLLKILGGVRQRTVLSQKGASQAKRQPGVMCAGVDKLNARFKNFFPVTQLVGNAAKYDFSVKETSLREKGRFLKVSNFDVEFHLRYIRSHNSVTQLISNPNRFFSWGSYFTTLSSLIPIEIIKEMEVSRMDLNLDFACEFGELIQGIDIRNKSLSVKYEDKGGSRTGISFGAGNEVVVIYDKGKKERMQSPCARVEQRLAGAKLPTRSIIEVPEALRQFDAFQVLEGLNIRVQDGGVGENLKQKLAEFKLLLRRDGFYSARKTFDGHRNFKRDFAGLIEVSSWSSQPKELYKSHIKAFLGLESGS